MSISPEKTQVLLAEIKEELAEQRAKRALEKDRERKCIPIERDQ